MDKSLKYRSILFAATLSAMFASCTVDDLPSLPLSGFRTIALCKEWIAKGKVVPGAGCWLFYKPEIEYVRKPLPQGNIQRITAFSRMLRDKGILLFVVPIPNKIDIYPEKLAYVNCTYPVKPEMVAFKQALADSGVMVIDLVGGLIGAKDTCDVFGPFDTHWNPEGIEIAARIIADYIAPHLDSFRIRHDTRLMVTDTIFTGTADIALKHYTEGLPQPNKVRVSQVWRAPGIPYRDDKRSRIFIVGDSFVDHCRWWNANLGAHIARYTGAPTRTWFSLQANAEALRLFARKPEAFSKKGIVIWAFTSRVLRDELKMPKKAPVTL
jgi:hypothetical protein